VPFSPLPCFPKLWDRPRLLHPNFSRHLLPLIHPPCFFLLPECNDRFPLASFHQMPSTGDSLLRSFPCLFFPVSPPPVLFFSPTVVQRASYPMLRGLHCDLRFPQVPSCIVCFFLFASPNFSFCSLSFILSGDDVSDRALSFLSFHFPFSQSLQTIGFLPC